MSTPPHLQSLEEIERDCIPGLVEETLRALEDGPEKFYEAGGE